MKRDAIDFARIPVRHEQIHIRLEDWSKWVRVWYQPWQQSPIFRQYRSHAWQWERPELKAQLNQLECHETERAVSFLPDKHRTAIRWAYVYDHVPVNAVRRELAVTREDLAALIDNGRDMLKNRLKEKLRDS